MENKPSSFIRENRKITTQVISSRSKPQQNSSHKLNYMSFVLMLVSLFNNAQGAQIVIQVQSNPSVVQYSWADLIVYGSLGSSVASGGYISITAPYEVGVKSGTLTCTMIQPTTTSVKSCTASGKTITAQLSTTLAATAFELHILSSVTNPTTTAPTSSFVYTTLTSTGITIESQNTNINLVATVGTLSSISLTPNNLIVGSTSNLLVSFAPNHQIPAGGQLTVQFPKWNPLATSVSQLDYLQGAVSCTTQAVLTSSLSCSFSNQILLVQGGVGSAISAGITISFSVAGFRNPLSTDIISGFNITTQDSAGGSIDYGTASVQVTSAAVLTQTSITVDPSTSNSIQGIVQEVNIMRVAFSSPVPLNQGCRINIIFPSQFNVATITSVQTFGMFGALTTVNNIVVSTSSNTLTISQCSSYTSNSLSAYIILNTLKMPNDIKITNSLQIYVTSSSNAKIAQITSGVQFTASSGLLTLQSILPQTTVVQTSTKIAFSIQPAHGLDTTSRVTISFPSGFTPATTCSVTLTSNVNTAALCSVSGQSLIITNFLSTAFAMGSSNYLSFTLGSVTLPSSVTSYTGLTITTALQEASDNQFYTVDTLTTSIPFTLTPGSIVGLVAPSSIVAYATTVYTFTITPQHQIPTNGYITITYPSQISIPDSSYSQSQCTGWVNFPTTPTCVITTSSNTLQITKGFRLSTSPAGGTSYQFQVPGIQNPLSLSQSSTFTIFTYTTDGNLIDQVTSGIYIQMVSTAYMQSSTITLGSYINSATTSYTFSLTPTVPVTSQNRILIAFPDDVTLPTNPALFACYSNDTTIIKSVTCNFYQSAASTTLQINIVLANGLSQINTLQAFRITVNSITNPISTAPTGNFNIKIIDSNSNSLNQNPGTLTISTSTPSPLAKATLVASTTGAGQAAYYTITLYPLHNILTGGGLLIIYPSQVSVPGALTVTVLSQATQSNPTYAVDISARQILVTSAFQTNFAANGISTISIKISGFQNPLTSAVTSSFIVKTMNIVSGNYFYIDQIDNGLVLNSNCNYPCQTCTTSQSSVCLSCYAASTLYMLQGTTCVSQCTIGYYYDSTKLKCLACDPSCLDCKNSATTCTSCGIGNLLYLYNNICSSTCPSGYVQDSNLNSCDACTNGCATCVGTTSTCTSCSAKGSSPYLYQSSCYSTCPSQISVLQNGNCVSCDSSCSTCSGTSSYCTSCLSYMKYDTVQHTCSAACAAGTQIYSDTLGTCAYCSSTCATCSGTVNTCTSCSNGLVLNSDSTCKSSCSATNQVAISSVCQTCQLPCAQCKSSTNHCTKCSGDYLLYNTTCVQYCPPKYNESTTGQCVLVGLICPAGFTVNEAGDGCIPNNFECKSGYMINQQRTACIPKPGFPVPFPFLILSVCLGLLVMGSYLKDKFFTKVLTNLIALIGSLEMLIYILMVCYAGALMQWGAFILSLVSVLMLMTANIAFYLVFKRQVVNDPAFAKWQKLHPKTQKYLPLIALIVNFKTMKIVYGGFFALENCQAQFQDPIKNFFKPMRMISYFSFIFVYIPIIIADIFIFINVKWGYQLQILGIESFLLAIFLTVIMLLEMRNPEKLFLLGDEQYTRIKPKGFDGDTLVMSGIQMDESTLIRGKVVNEDYEVLLRKRALVSILGQVGKNFLNAQKKGVDLGGDIDQVMTKFDEGKLKLRRAFSLEEIKEEVSWNVSGDEKRDDSDYEEEQQLQRRYSFPLTPRTLASVPNPQFNTTLLEIKNAAKEQLQDNVYAEVKAPPKNNQVKKKKTVSRRTQTYLRELLSLNGEDLQDSDLEIVMEDDAEIDVDYARDLIDNVIDGLSESESAVGGKKRSKKKKKSNLNPNRAKEVPDFELIDIMGDFEIDDIGNFIILRREKGELLDKRERRVNRRGYLVDRFGNVINNQGQIIFKQVELDNDDEIPAPFGFEKRKKNLLKMGEDGEFKVNGDGEDRIEDDEEMIENELKSLKKKKSKKKRTVVQPDGSILEEENDASESSVDSLMADSPGKYQLDANDNTNEDDIIDKITRQKIPKKKGHGTTNKLRKSNNSNINNGVSKESARRQNSNLPPKRIRRDDTKELFPALAIENTEQKKLFKIAESIGGFATQIAQDQKSQNTNGGNTEERMSQERYDQLKQEHFKDLMSQSQMGKMPQKQLSMGPQGARVLAEAGTTQLQYNHQQSEKRLPQRQQMEKVYGNLHDVVTYEERQMYETMRQGAPSPFSSQITTRVGGRPETSQMGGDRRLRGLESIYLQKFDKKSNNGVKKQPKAKFRHTLNKFEDDPEILLDDGGYQKQNEVSEMVADRLDKLQRQYMSSTSSNYYQPVQSKNAGLQLSSAFTKKTGSVTGLANADNSLDPVIKGNWVGQ